MKKTEFVDSELEVIRFAEKDIIMTSDPEACGLIYQHGDGDPTACPDLEPEED